MRFAPHTALPRVKGVHQPRDSAVFFSKQTATATAGGRRASVGQVVTGGEGRKRGRAVIHILPPLFFARLCDTAGRRSPAQHSPPPPPPPPLSLSKTRLGDVVLSGKKGHALVSTTPPLTLISCRVSLVAVWVLARVSSCVAVKPAFVVMFP